MKVLAIFLALFLWTEAKKASVSKQDELKTDSAEDSLRSSSKQENRQASQKDDEEDRRPLSEMEFYKAKLIDMSNISYYNASEDVMLKAGDSGFFEDTVDVRSDNSTDFKPPWPNAIVPYSISNVFNTATRILLARALLEVHTRTCVRFVPRNSTDKDYVNITESGGCHSAMGRLGGAQVLSFGENCHHFYIMIHEMMHVIGFGHEQTRHDRDDYITILWDTIQKGKEGAFKKGTKAHKPDLGGPYDYNSISHYGAFDLAVNSSAPTMISKNKDKFIAGAITFSDTDIMKIQKLYKCQIHETNKIESDCADSGGWCAEYAKRGDCDTYSEWMKTSCMKACGVCGAKCIDHGSDCEELSGQGLCESDSGYMKAFCKKSCKVCD